MRILVAGATGAVGRPLVGLLLEAGHEVWGLTRSEEHARALEASGAHGVVGDALVRDDVERAVHHAQPEVVMQQLTALPQKVTPKAMLAGYAQTTRLRTEGTANLIAAAPGTRLITQSIAFALRPEGPWVKTEDAALWTDGPEPAGSANRALKAMEDSVVANDGLVLRYGFFYGPGTWYHRNGAIGRMIAKRRYPIIGDGAGMSSWVHVDDAAAATLAAVQHGQPGVYNVADDHPAPAREWIPAFAEAIGAKRPRRVPAWLARRIAGPIAVYYATQVRGADNLRAKAQLQWTPRWPDWREGFRETL